MGTVIELDNDIEVIVEAPQSIKVTVESQEVGTSEFNSDSALGMLSSAIITLQNLLKNLEYDLTGVAQEKTLEGGVNEILSKIKGVSDAIADIDLSKIDLSKVEQAIGEVKDAVANIDLTSIEQAIQYIKNVTAREDTLIQGVGDIIKAVENIDFTDLENSIAEVKDAVANIDFSALAKEETLTQGISSVESKVEEESQAIQRKIDNIDLSIVAKQGENIHATNTAIYESLKSSSGYIRMTNSEYDEFKAHIIEVTNNILN